METSSQQQYVALMEEIKNRANVIEQVGTSPSLLAYKRAHIELICLQLRMILENIAMACLIANGDDFGKKSKSIANEYRPEQIFRRVESVNPDCYPQPIQLIPKSADYKTGLGEIADGLYQGEIKERASDDWLTREMLKNVYGRLGNLLHSKNPMQENSAREQLEKEVPKWYNLIVNLITHHKIAVLDDQKMYIVIVGHRECESDSPRGVRVQMTEWEKINIPDMGA